MRAGRRLEADLREAADLAQRPLQRPHQLECALGALRILRRMQAGVAGKRGDAFVEARVVLHRAGAERVDPGVEIEVPAREAVVMADDLRLGHLRQAGGLAAQQVLGDQIGDRPVAVGDARGGDRGGTAPGNRALVDRHRVIALHRRLRGGAARRVGRGRGHADTPAVSRSLPAAWPTASPEQLREPIDLLDRALLGDRDEEAVAVLGGQRDSGGHATLGAVVEDALDGSVEGDRELADDWSVVKRLDALDGRQATAGVVGPADQQLAEFDQTLTTEPAQVDHAAERVERLGGADVVRRLFAADVLLAGLQREDETAPTVDVDRLAGDPPGHAADLLLGRAEEAERRAAVVEAVAERLPLPDGDVDAAVAGGAKDPERDRVAGGDEECAGRVGDLGDSLEVLDAAEEARVLDDHGRGLVVDGGSERLEIGHPAVERNLGHLGRVALGVRAQGLAAVWMQAGRDDEAAALGRADRQVAGGGDRRGALVEAGARQRQSGQLGHRRLELEHRLQAALGDLGLVGRVGRQELGAGDDRVDDRRRVVVVHAGAEEADLRLGIGVARRERAHPLVDLGLAEAVGQVESTVEPDVRGDVEELLDRGDADRVEHLATLVAGDRGVAAHPRAG